MRLTNAAIRGRTPPHECQPREPGMALDTRETASLRWGTHHRGHRRDPCSPDPNLKRNFMNIQEQHWAVQNYGIGQPVARTEDPRLVRGEGRYTDDIDVPGQAYLAMVRSRHAPG